MIWYKNKRILVALGIVALAILFVLLRGIINTGPQTAPESFDPNGPAIVLEGEALYAEIANDSQFTAVRKDLNYYARQKLEPYQNNQIQTIFKVMSHKLTGKTLEIIGQYEELDEQSTIEIKLLNHGKIATIIRTEGVDLSGLTYPSSSREDQFIGSLPVENDTLKLDYLPDSNTFYIVLKQTMNQALIDQTTTYMKQSLDTEDLSVFNISVVGQNEQGRIVSVRIPPMDEE